MRTRVRQSTLPVLAGLMLAVGSAGAQPGAERERARVRKEPELTVVPDLRGRRVEELPPILETARLRQGEISSAHSGEPEGLISDQDPPPGSAVPRWTPVAVTVSLGPARGDRRRLVPVPDVVGRPLEEARQILEESQLRLGRPSWRGLPSRPAIVLEQHPAPPAEVPRGSAVQLVLGTPGRELPPPPPPRDWLVPAILGAAISLAAAAGWWLARRRPWREKPREAAPGIEVHAVRDEGSQRLDRQPAASRIGLEVHPDDAGRQSVRFRGGP